MYAVITWLEFFWSRRVFDGTLPGNAETQLILLFASFIFTETNVSEPTPTQGPDVLSYFHRFNISQLSSSSRFFALTTIIIFIIIITEFFLVKFFSGVSDLQQ
jgi:hypothetical protein